MRRRDVTIPAVHEVNPLIAGDRMNITLVGVGGNGCRVLHGLAQLHLALVALRGSGFHVKSWDPDVVSEANVGRTVYSLSDVGLHKATVLTNRINCAYGLDWEAEPAPFIGFINKYGVPEILITCVDSASSRRVIHKGIHRQSQAGDNPIYWIDMGNSQKSGQVILGEPFDRKTWTAKSTDIANGKGNKTRPPRLPCVTDLYPEILKSAFVESNEPSCSLQEAIESQDLFINAHVSTWALQLLWEVFRNGSIDRHGYFINLETGRANPLMVASSLGQCAGIKG